MSDTGDDRAIPRRRMLKLIVGVLGACGLGAFGRAAHAQGGRCTRCTSVFPCFGFTGNPAYPCQSTTNANGGIKCLHPYGDHS
jgi:hypothetical protein